METYYHLTTEEALPEILKNGIVPKTGENCVLVGDVSSPRIFLCGENDLPYWTILLDRPIALQVTGVKKSDLETRKYGFYTEYVTKKAIKAKNIKQVPLSAEYDEVCMIDLCEDFLYYLCDVITDLVLYFEVYAKKHGSLASKARRNTLIGGFRCAIRTLKKLDFSVLTESQIELLLLEYGSKGSYTFFDTFRGTEKRLYEQLLCYPDEEITELAREAYDYICNTFDFCLGLDTGDFEC